VEIGGEPLVLLYGFLSLLLVPPAGLACLHSLALSRIKYKRRVSVDFDSSADDNGVQVTIRAAGLKVA
jgi:hypothetical protein